MSKVLNVSTGDMLRNIKLSCKIPDVVEAIATQKIITETALELGITVEEKEIQQEGDRLRLEKKLVKAKDTWNWLKKYYLSLDDFEQLIHTNILTKKLANHLFAGQIEHFFYEHQVDYTTAVTYEVIFDDRDLALEMFYALQEGEISFQEIARQYIQDPQIRRAGGYQGIRHRKDFRPEIAAVVFASIPPQVLKPIVNPKGVHLIWVEEIIQPKLDEQMRVEIEQDLFSAWLRQQIEQREILIQLDLDSNLHPSEELLPSA